MNRKIVWSRAFDRAAVAAVAGLIVLGCSTPEARSQGVPAARAQDVPAAPAEDTDRAVGDMGQNDYLPRTQDRNGQRSPQADNLHAAIRNLSDLRTRERNDRNPHQTLELPTGFRPQNWPLNASGNSVKLTLDLDGVLANMPTNRRGIRRNTVPIKGYDLSKTWRTASGERRYLSREPGIEAPTLINSRRKRSRPARRASFVRRVRCFTIPITTRNGGSVVPKAGSWSTRNTRENMPGIWPAIDQTSSRKYSCPLFWRTNSRISPS